MAYVTSEANSFLRALPHKNQKQPTVAEVKERLTAHRAEKLTVLQGQAQISPKPLHPPACVPRPFTQTTLIGKIVSTELCKAAAFCLNFPAQSVWPSQTPASHKLATRGLSTLLSTK